MVHINRRENPKFHLFTFLYLRGSRGHCHGVLWLIINRGIWEGNAYCAQHIDSECSCDPWYWFAQSISLIDRVRRTMSGDTSIFRCGILFVLLECSNKLAMEWCARIPSNYSPQKESSQNEQLFSSLVQVRKFPKFLFICRPQAISTVRTILKCLSVQLNWLKCTVPLVPHTLRCDISTFLMRSLLIL